MAAPFPLTIKAGPAARRLIEREGLHPDLISAMPAAAGGPKWLVLNRLDRAVFGQWFQQRGRQPLHLIGSSIGAWRFAMLMNGEPMAALDRFEETYVNVRLRPYADPRLVTEATQTTLDELLDDAAVQRILEHPTMRLHIVTARARGFNALEPSLLQGLGMMGAYVANAVHRNLVQLHFQRVVFHDARSQHPFYKRGLQRPVNVQLTAANLKPALMATASIPMVLRGVRDIPGAPEGTYRDGGICDYQFDIPAPGIREGLIFFPHYDQTITPGWFDKSLRRRIRHRYSERTLLVAPSPEFIASLPFGKIPDRNDFIHFRVRHHDRVAYWRKVLQATERLHDAFLEMIEKQNVLEHVQPFEA